MARTNKASSEMVCFPIEGELTIFAVQKLRESILTLFESNSDIEIDLSRVSEIDAAGMQLLISAKLGAIRCGKTLRYSGHSKHVMDMIDLCDLGRFFGDQIVLSSAATQH